MKQVYFFGKETEGSASMKELLGGKGANLAEMSGLGVPVPPGFTISTQACELFQKEKTLSTDLMDEIILNLKKLESEMSKEFGGENPLLVSVRSGAAVSMPGMMDTILNLGLNDIIVETRCSLVSESRYHLDLNLSGCVSSISHQALSLSDRALQC